MKNRILVLFVGLHNEITAPKTLHLALETGHWTYPEQTEKMNNWIIEKLKANK